MSSSNGAVKVSFASPGDNYSNQDSEVTAVNRTQQPPSSNHNHGIRITLTSENQSVHYSQLPLLKINLRLAPDSCEVLSSSNLGLSNADLDTNSSISDLPQELSDIFGMDDLGADLDPIDFHGFQLLMNPDNTVTDAATEDHFRLDRL
jgi:hypothetical protein